MKLFLAFVAFATLAFAAPQRGGADKDATVLKYDNNNIGVEGYNFGFETSNGISQQEQGQVAAAPEGEAISVTGQFTYVGTDGVTYTVNYVADQNGFQPQGAHLPHAR